MGVYDTYGQTQLKVGDVTMHDYKVGDKVPVPDGLYFAYEGVVVVQNGVFIAELPTSSLYTKWGDTLEITNILNQFHPLTGALSKQFGGDQFIIAFDVDGTLIDGDEKPLTDTIEVLKALARHEKNTVIVWSGGGADYAQLWVERLGLQEYVHGAFSKLACPYKVDVAIDDQPAKLGKYNVRIAYEKK